MLVRDLLKTKNREIITTTADTEINEAMAALIDNAISCLPVLDKNGKIINHASFEDISCVSPLITANQNNIYFITEEYKQEKGGTSVLLKLICFKINTG